MGTSSSFVSFDMIVLFGVPDTPCGERVSMVYADVKVGKGIQV